MILLVTRLDRMACGSRLVQLSRERSRSSWYRIILTEVVVGTDICNGRTALGRGGTVSCL